MSSPVSSSERHVVLDALRGLALLGIALANFPEFGLWTFLPACEQELLPMAGPDGAVRFMQYVLVDGKFYTIFSLLFGVGFSIILMRHGRRLFVRRMLILLVIGALHLLYIWSGDILLLYAVCGLLLVPLSWLSSRVLFCLAAVLMLLPVALDTLGWSFEEPLYTAWWTVAEASGIYEDNFAWWLHDADTYQRVYAFLKQGAVERMWEFALYHRLPKVLSLFICGYLIGRHRLYARFREFPLRRLLLWSAAVGLPTSLLYAVRFITEFRWWQFVISVLSAVSAFSMALAYVFLLCLLLRRSGSSAPLWARLLAFPGRMALTCYILQSVAGMFLFYGIGLGLGTTLPLWQIELIAIGVYLLEVLLCVVWLRLFRFGPLEWLWRMLTYGRYFQMVK